MSNKVLIAGGTGLVGSRLTTMLEEKNYKVSHLSRSSQPGGNVPTFRWDPKSGFIDEGVLKEIDYVVNLAGAGIADKKWTPARKKVILESRTQSTRLLAKVLKEQDHQVKAVVAASAIGYYGYDTGGIWKKEESRFGDDFLATVTKEWEAAIDEIAQTGLRTVKLRIGIVLSEKGGALKEMAKPIRWGIGAPLGRGDQFMSWIHLDDLCQMFIFAMENDNLKGIYNAVGPHPDTNKLITKTLATVLKKPLILPNVPGFVLKIVLGEMASMVLGGSKVSAEKISETGFEFKFPELKTAVADLLKS